MSPLRHRHPALLGVASPLRAPRCGDARAGTAPLSVVPRGRRGVQGGAVLGEPLGEGSGTGSLARPLGLPHADVALVPKNVPSGSTHPS